MSEGWPNNSGGTSATSTATPTMAGNVDPAETVDKTLGRRTRGFRLLHQLDDPGDGVVFGGAGHGDAQHRFGIDRPAKTLSPGRLVRGMLSPVTGLSSMPEVPSLISPSAGMRSPGRTSTTCPMQMAMSRGFADGCRSASQRGGNGGGYLSVLSRPAHPGEGAAAAAVARRPDMPVARCPGFC